MSTRCNILIKDNYDDRIQLYRHCDGYPEGKSGVIATLPEALQFAWDGDRFEASDFAAAIVRAWKTGGGYIYIDGSLRVSEDDFIMAHGDIEWFYVIRQDGATKKIMVDVFDTWEGKEKPVRTLTLGEEWKVEAKEETDDIPF